MQVGHYCPFAEFEVQSEYEFEFTSSQSPNPSPNHEPESKSNFESESLSEFTSRSSPARCKIIISNPTRSPKPSRIRTCWNCPPLVCDLLSDWFLTLKSYICIYVYICIQIHHVHISTYIYIYYIHLTRQLNLTWVGVYP